VPVRVATYEGRASEMSDCPVLVRSRRSTHRADAQTGNSVHPFRSPSQLQASKIKLESAEIFMGVFYAGKPFSSVLDKSSLERMGFTRIVVVALVAKKSEMA
jgi:hypothetical protein